MGNRKKQTALILRKARLNKGFTQQYVAANANTNIMAYQRLESGERDIGNASIDNAKEILARFDGSDYVGIVPHHVTLKYCESMFPAKYGPVIDFTHVYADDIAALGEDIEWLPEAEARLIQDSE